jgi:hypothetical protein
MSAAEIFESIKQALQEYVVDQGIVTPEFNWLKELIASIYDWFTSLLVD